MHDIESEIETKAASMHEAHRKQAPRGVELPSWGDVPEEAKETWRSVAKGHAAGLHANAESSTPSPKPPT